MTKESRHVTVDTLMQNEVAQLAYDADVTPDEVRSFEKVVAEKMLRCGFTRVERTELYLKVKGAIREFQKQLAIKAAVEAFERSNAKPASAISTGD